MIPPINDAIDPAPPRRLYVILLVLLPVVLQTAIVARFGSRMFLWDEFVYVPAFEQIGEGKPWLHWIWQQHNEHRIVWTKLLFFAHAGMSGWNPMVDMYVSALLTGLIAWGIWTLYRAAGSGHPAYFIPVALLLCSLAQYMNMLYGLMTCHYFALAGMIWAIVFLTRETQTGLVAAIACAFAAVVSCLSAMVIVPIGLAMLVMTHRKPERWIAWIVAMLVLVLVYFYRYQSPSVPAVTWTSASAIRQAADTFLVCLGSPLSGGDLLRSRALGVITIVAFAVLCWRVRALGTRRHAGLIALGFVGIGCAAAVAFGRSATSAAVGLESKYVTYSTLALVATYLGWASLPRLPARRAILAGLTVVIAIGWTTANVVGFEQARAWQQARHRAAYLLQTIERQPDENLASIYFLPQLRVDAAYLRATRLGPFHDTIDVLMPPRWRDGLPTSPITATSPVQAHLVCPVDTLVDIGLVVSPVAGSEPRRGESKGGSVEVTVTTGGRVVGQGRLAADRAQPSQYVRVTLDQPLRGCRGADLIVAATSGTADSGGAFHAWTYPVYAASVTRQGGRLIDQRTLGIAFNAFSYGLID
jgi:hypothetical protein